MKYANFGSLSALPVSQVQIAGYAYQINYLAYLIEKIQKDISNLDPEDQGEAISTLQTAVEALRDEIENIQTGGGNAYVTQVTNGSCGSGVFYLNYNTLPDGAVIDKYEIVANLSGLTRPTKFDIMPIAGGGLSAVADGGYASWTVSHSISGNDTITTLTLGLNSLYTTAITSTDAITYARIYFHI